MGGAIAFLVVDLGFLAANLSKVLSGGWFPLIIAAAVFLVLTTWQKGREAVVSMESGCREMGQRQYRCPSGKKSL